MPFFEFGKIDSPQAMYCKIGKLYSLTLIFFGILISTELNYRIPSFKLSLNLIGFDIFIKLDINT